MPRTAVPLEPPHRSPTPAPASSEGLSGEVVSLARSLGCAAAGIASAEPFLDTRDVLHERRSRGVHGGMQFTYRNPERSTDPARLVAGARSLVVGAWDYGHADDDDDDRPSGAHAASGCVAPSGTVLDGRATARVAAYARHDYYRDLRHALESVAEHVRRAGWRVVVAVDDNALVDRAAAHRAGLGWFGKNSLLLLPGLGSRVVLGSVVTDAPLVPTTAEPMDHGAGCGTCRRCQSACPTGALDEAGVVDARHCLAWLLQAPGSFPLEHRAALGDRLYGCDECQRVCPVNRRADRQSSESRPPGPGHRARVDVLGVLTASDEELMNEFGRWYIPGRDPRYLRRNALVVLGNVGDPADPATRAALTRWAMADDELLAEHARWALGRLGSGPGALDGSTMPAPAGR